MRKFSFSKAMNLTGRPGTALLMDQLGEDIKASDVIRPGEEVFVDLEAGPDAYKGYHTVQEVSPDGNADVIIISPEHQGDASGTIEKTNTLPMEFQSTTASRWFLSGSLVMATIAFIYLVIKTS
jgi:hypothetical protein